MATLLDDLDPYGAQSHQRDGHDRKWRESTPDDTPASPIRLLDLSFLAAVTPRSPERSALIDFSVSPPPPLYPSSRPSAQPDLAPVHLLDDSFAVESPIRVGSNSDDAAGPQVEEKENRPLARPARKRWSVMTKLREEQQQNLPRQSSPPVKDLSPFRAAGDASVFLSPSQLGVVDLSLIADEGASFLAVADTSETAALSRLDPVPHAKDENLSGDSSLVSQTGGGQIGGMSVLLRGLGGDASATAATKENDTGRDDPALAQSSILPITLTSSHRRALQQSVAHFGSPPLLLNEGTFSRDDPSSSSRGGEEVSLLNCSTASFKDYRDSPRKPRRLLSSYTEDWSLEEEEEEEKGSSRPDGEEGETPRPPRRRTGRISDATSASSSSDGDSFRLDRFQTSGFGTGILDQSPPTAALKPESTGTLRLELGLGGLVGAFASPPREASASPPVSPVTELATSTRTVMASSQLSSRASTIVVAAAAEGDLLGVDDALARSSSEAETTRTKPRVPVVQCITATPTPAVKGMSGAERLKRRLEELRAQKQQTVSSASAASSTHTRASTTAPAATLAPISATPAAARRSFARPSLGPAAPPTSSTTATSGRLARPRLSALPTSSSTAPPPPPPPPPATPGERKESTAARLERLRSERKERETIRSATTATPGRAGGGGLVRSASLVAPRDRSLASLSSAGSGSSDVRSGARLPSSQSLADLSSIGRQSSSIATTTASRRTSLLPAPASTAGRRTLPAPSSEMPRRRMSLAPMSSAPPPSPPARSSRQSLAPTSRDNGLDRSLPSSSSSASRASFASIRRSSGLQQISEPVAGRRGSLVAPMKPNLASFASAHDRTPFRSVQAQTPSSEMAASRYAPTITSGIARAPSTRRLSRLARPSMGSLGPR